VCTAQCAFCAFYGPALQEGYLLTKAQLAQKIEETLSLGGQQILLQGGLHRTASSTTRSCSLDEGDYPSLWITA